MAEIADVMHASFVLDAARQELSCRMLWSGVNRHVISSFMEEMAAVLQEAVMRWRGAKGEEETLIEEVERQSIKDWLRRLEIAAYNIRAMAEEKSSSMSQIEDKIKATLEEINEEYWSLGYERLPLASCMEHPCIGPCVGQETFDVFVGRDHDKQKIIDLLIQVEAEAEAEVEHAIILPIFGLAGVGKTMLAKQLFHDNRFQGYHKAWVDMSCMYYFNLNEIAASILSQVPGRESYKGEPGLNEPFVGHKMKLLVVLDGLWETYPSRMNNLKQLLFDLGMNLIVIVTTASKAVADHMSLAVKPYQLHPLSDDMCLAIIKRTSGFEERQNKDNAVAGESIGLEIATRCGGLPLAAQALGCILFVNPQQWAADMTWDFGVWHSPPPLLTISVLCHLMTAYQRLIQHTEFRRCFALCAFIFPKGKGHSIVQHELILQFSAFYQYDDFKINAVCDLLDNSFLLHEKSPSSVAEYAEESARLTMNDLVHNFARYVLGDRMIVVDGGNGVPSSHVNNSNAFCAIVSNLDDGAPSDLSKILPAGTRAIRFEGCSKMVLSHNAFSFAKGLCFLDLSGCSVQKLPFSITELEELRYLNAPEIQDPLLPRQITGLSRLRYLSLRGSCNLASLPETFGRLKYLHHLNLSGCLSLQALPESVTECKNLEALILSGCSGLLALPDPVMGWRTIYLEHLDLSGCSRLQVLPKSITDCKSLKYLDISRCSGLKILPEPFDMLTELTYFNLSCCWELQELPKSISFSPYVEHLDLSGCFCVRGITEALDGLTRLKYLNISHPCGYHVEDWFHLKGLDDVLPKLRKLRFLGLSMCLDPFYYSLPPVASEKFLEDCITGLDNLQRPVQE